MTTAELLDQHTGGTYASMNLSKQSAQQLAQWCEQQGFPHDNPEGFHCTLCYSRVPVPHAVAIQGPVHITAQSFQWEHLGDSANVLLIKCQKAQEIFDLLKRHGASHDWPKYQPHVTIFGDRHIDLPTQLPDFPLIFDSIVVEPLDL